MPRYVEFQSCCALVKWWCFYSRINKIHEGLLFHCPNQSVGGARHGRNLKLMGVRSGTPDYVLAIARGGWHGMFMEMKSPDGRLRPEQKEMGEKLAEQGYKVVVCRSADEARREIEGYVGAK